MSVNFEEISREFDVSFGEAIQMGGGSVKITDARHLFYYGARLDSMDALLDGCEKVTSVAGMFDNCTSLTSLDLSRLDTSEVTAMDSVFYNCRNLAELNLRGWNTSKVATMNSMFASCVNLTELDISDWDVSNVAYMNEMFGGCGVKRLDFSRWDTSKAKNMRGMFSGCAVEEIIGFSATAAENIRIGFPIGYYDERKPLKRLTFRTDIENAIRSDIDISYCSFERSGLVEMFNSLPDISDDSPRYITITGNPCVGRSFETIESLETYVWDGNLHDEIMIFEYAGKRYTMDGNEMLRFMARYIDEEPLDFVLLEADVELLTEEDRKIAIRKGWNLVEV